MSDQDQPPTDGITDAQLEQVLARWKALPSARLQQRAATFPWEQRGNTREHARWIPKTARLVVLMVALLVAGTVALTPPLRALAHDMLSVFIRTPSDAITNQELEANFPLPSSEDPHVGLSIADAERAAGFRVWQPHSVPEGHRLQEAVYMPAEQMVILAYVAGDYPFVDPRMLSGFSLMQQPAARAASNKSVFPVGASAVIETVQIGDVTGEYVEGAWCGGNSDPETMMYWCGDSFLRTLHWQRGDWVFTLSAVDVGGEYDVVGGYRPSITREQMIDLATNLVPPDAN
jgi:hypothetical protein